MTYPGHSPNSRGVIPASPLDYVARRCEERDTHLAHQIQDLEERMSDRMDGIDAKMDLWITRGVSAVILILSGLSALDPQILQKTLVLVSGGAVR